MRIPRLHLLTFVLLATLACTSLPVSGTRAQDSQGIAAIVNDDVISLHDLDKRIALFLATSNLQDTPENRRRLAPEVLRTLIDESLKNQEMRRQNITVSQMDLDRALAQVAGQLRVQPNELPQVLSQRGIGMSTLIDQLEAEIGWMKAVSRTAGDRAVVGANEVDEELARLAGDTTSVEYRLSEILLPLDDPVEQARTEELARRLVAEARSGANFASLARTFSQGPSAANGGDLGWVRGNTLDPQIGAVVERLQPGEVSDPLRAQGGYFILFLAARRSGEATTPGKITLTLQQVFLPLARTATETEVSQTAKAAQDLSGGVQTCADLEARGKQAGPALSGSLGTVDLQQVPAELRQVLAPLRAGEITPPLRTGDGFLVLMVCDRKEEEAGQDMRASIERRLRDQRLAAAARRQLRELRRSALLDIRL